MNNREVIKTRFLALTGVLVFLLAWPANAETSKGTIKVNVHGLRSNSGFVHFALFNTKDGFPDKRHKALRLQRTRISQNRAVTCFKDLPLGHYAVGIIHDENGNGKLDSNWLRIPKEGYGVSNNATGHFGPPSFAEATFELNASMKNVRIRALY